MAGYDPTKATQKSTLPAPQKNPGGIPQLGSPQNQPSLVAPFRKRSFTRLDVPLTNAGNYGPQNGRIPLGGSAFMFWFSTNSTDQLLIAFDDDSLPFPFLPGMGFIGRPFGYITINVPTTVANAVATILVTDAFPDEDSFRFLP